MWNDFEKFNSFYDPLPSFNTHPMKLSVSNKVSSPTSEALRT